MRLARRAVRVPLQTPAPLEKFPFPAQTYWLTGNLSAPAFVSAGGRRQSQVIPNSENSVEVLVLKRSFVLILILFIALTSVVPAQSARRKGARTPARPVAVVPPSPEQTRELAEAATQARTRLIKATQDYQDSLEKLLTFYVDEEKRAADLVEKRRKLLDLGVIAKRELDDSSQKLKAAQNKIAEVRKQMDEAGEMLAEVIAAEEDAKKAATAKGKIPDLTRPGLVMVRYTGLNNWSLGEAGKIDAFFQAKFGRPLPISAWGQSPTHDRLGFDHRHAMDVAVHPDSVEGRALMDYLRTLGIPFTAFRAPVAGSATGVHIHIGQPSHRVIVKS